MTKPIEAAHDAFLDVIEFDNRKEATEAAITAFLEAIDVGQVARELCALDGCLPDHTNGEQELWELYVKEAQAAISAIIKQTKESS